jgi:hypothetical protein
LNRPNHIPDLSKVQRINAEWASAEVDFSKARQEARNNILFYNWCGEILEEYIGAHYPGIISIFLFKIVPTRQDVDDWIWSIVGDVPPTYLTCDICPDPAGALEGYIGAMQEWVEAAAAGRSVADLVPVNVPASPENSKLLSSRLQFLDRRILPELRADNP